MAKPIGGAHTCIMAAYAKTKTLVGLKDLCEQRSGETGQKAGHRRKGNL